MDSEARTGWLRTAAIWFAGASIILVAVNAGLVLRNQNAQRAVNQRQAAINQAAQVSRVNQLLIETVARAAVQRKDDALMAVLERHGVKVNVNPAPSPPASAPQGKTP